MLSSYQGLDLISHLKLQGGEQNDIIVVTPNGIRDLGV